MIHDRLRADQLTSPTVQAFLGLHLDAPFSLAIDLAAVQEVFTLSVEDLTVMPNMAGSVLGLIYHRNQILWAIDLGDFLGYRPQRSSLTEYAVAIVRAEETPLALAVESIGGVLRLSTADIRPFPDPNSVPEAVLACSLGRYEENASAIVLLDAPTLVQSILQCAPVVRPA